MIKFILDAMYYQIFIFNRDKFITVFTTNYFSIFYKQ